MTLEQFDNFVNIYGLKDVERVDDYSVTVGNNIGIYQQKQQDYSPMPIMVFFLYEPDEGEPCHSVFHRYSLGRMDSDVNRWLKYHLYCSGEPCGCGGGI